MAAKPSYRTFVDVRTCGIGNIVLITAASLVHCRRLGLRTLTVVCDDVESVKRHMRHEALDFVSAPPRRGEGWKEVNPSVVCTASSLVNPLTVAMLRDIVVPLDVRVDPDVQAGFSIRTPNPAFDGPTRYMNDLAMRSMKRQMTRYGRVLVFTNDASNLGDLPPGARVWEPTDGQRRNLESHWRQWHALAKCPVVYHSIRGVHDLGNTTSTFAPTAAMYGGGIVVGIDNAGGVSRMYDDETYVW